MTVAHNSNNIPHSLLKWCTKAVTFTPLIRSHQCFQSSWQFSSQRFHELQHVYCQFHGKLKISGDASAVKEPGHFEVRKSSSQVTRMHFCPQKSWRPFNPVHTITEAPPCFEESRAEPGLEPGRWIFQPGHLTWRAWCSAATVEKGKFPLPLHALRVSYEEISCW